MNSNKLEQSVGGIFTVWKGLDLALRYKQLLLWWELRDANKTETYFRKQNLLKNDINI